jgi:hypothetical protein
MKKSDFIYHFSKIYFGEAVKETILIENWEEGDFDLRYVEYVDEFQKLSKECLTKKYSNKEIINILTVKKKKLVNNFNEAISKRFVDEVIKHPLKSSRAVDLVKNKIPLGGSITSETLMVFRELEESIYYHDEGEV